MNKNIEIVRGSGNIYADFNLPDADVRQTKILLASEIVKVLKTKNISTRQAEKLTGVDHSVFVKLRKPELKGMTIDRLITILNKLDQKVDFAITVTERRFEQKSKVHA
ncbi:MAG: XRE family transcriptional regulator [Candidatus Hinthialibacter antarcticus]|nr:XRE family transcriptional regulator [Candidatus Hinthialibacter antarcticus]